MAWVIALAAAALCAGLELWLSGRRPFVFLASLNQPRWALPTAGWIAVGGAFYTLTTIALGRMVAACPDGGFAAVLIVLVLLTDGFWNFLLFRLRHFGWAFLYLFPYAALVMAATVAAYAVDLFSGVLLTIYLAFLPYDFAWTHALKRLNPQFAGSSTVR